MPFSPSRSLKLPSISLLSLHLFRIVYCGALLFTDLNKFDWHFRQIKNIPSWHPIPLFELIGVTRISPSNFELLGILYFITLGFAIVGWRPRVWLGLSCLLFFFYHGQLLSLTKSPDSNYVFHSKNLCVFILFLLSAGKNIARRSFVFDIAKNFRELSKKTISSETLNLIVFSYGCVYLGASYVRIVTNGLGWMDGFTLKSFLVSAYFSEGSESALSLAKHHYVSQVLSIFVMLFEASFLFIFLFFRPYLFLFFGGLSLHISIQYFMKIDFLNYFGFGYLALLILILNTSRSGVVEEKLAKGQGKVVGKIIPRSYILVLLSCIFLRIESWPFSDWRVYSHAMMPSDVQFYRVQAENDEGTIFFPFEGVDYGLKIDQEIKMYRKNQDNESLEKFCERLFEMVRNKWDVGRVVVQKIDVSDSLKFSFSEICVPPG